MNSQGKRGGRQGSRAGLGTSSGRPMTGRPTTSSARPGTSAAASRARPTTAMLQEEEYDEEYDDEDYESEDDGDVFAFVPPDLGPAPEVISTSEVTASNQERQEPAEEEETFYYDEATGAVYDAEGRLVEMPTGFDASAVHQQQQEQQQYLQQQQFRHQEGAQMDHPLLSRPHTGDNMQGSQGLATTTTNEILPGHAIPQEPVAAARKNRVDEIDNVPSYRANGVEDTITAASLSNKLSRTSLDRKDSNSSSVNRDVNIPILTHARSISGFPAMDVLPEVDAGKPLTPYRPGSRDVGLTATGAPQLDQARRGSGQSITGLLPSHSTMRQRTNRLSQYADGGPTPTTDMKFNLDSPSYDDLDDLDAKYRPSSHLGQGEGMVHPNLNFQNSEGGSKGLRMVELEMETEEDSPYPEVRASVSNIDDEDLPVSTFRAWFLSFVLSTVAGAINTLLNFRYPAPALSPLAVLLVAYPIGKLMAAFLPIRVWTLPRWLGRASFSLNPGSFNIKEHTLISIVLNISIAQAYGLNTVVVLDSPEFYNSPRPIPFAIFFVISSQLIGFSLAGYCRRFLVFPASMIWPQNLVIATILNTLHAEEDGADKSMTRFRYFSFVMGGAFIWYFVPGFLFQALSSFGWLCWIWPNNFVVNTLFGTNSGVGLGFLTFDWTIVAYIGSPLVYPWWAECNIFAGFVILVGILCPALWFTNSLYTGYLPFNSSSSYDRFGDAYNITSIVTDRTQLDVAHYESYSSLFLSTTYIMVCASGFATTTAVLVHTVLYHGKSLWRGMRNYRTEEDDIHAKFMRKYAEVPQWWYAAIGLSMFVLSIITMEVWHTGLPIWGLVLALLIPVIYILPAGFIYAMTGSVVGTNLIGEFIAGYALPGNPIANLIFKVYALQTLSIGLNFVQDLKLGHYMKIPPRISFSAQLIFTIWLSIVQVGVQVFMFGNIPDLCTPDQRHKFTCPHARVFFTSSIVWGVLGPKRLFGEGGLFSPIYWAFLIGAVLPIPFWLLSRKYPKSWIKFVSVPIALNGVGYIPPASGIAYTSWFAVAFIFQYVIRKYNFRWWSKYNFVTSAALDSGTIFSTLLIFLALQLPKDGTLYVNWWGNNVAYSNIDALQPPHLVTPAQGFAPAPGAL